MNLWDRQRNPETGKLEPMLWFSRFTLYREQGCERSLLGTANVHRVKRGEKKGNSIPGAWERAFEKWQWKIRAEAWDTVELKRIADEFREDCDEWRRERFKDSRTLREKARQLLRLPVIRRTTTDEERTSYIVEAVPPTTLRAAAGILKTADELARITTRETLPKVEIEQESLNVDLTTLSIKQLERLAAGESIKNVLATPS